MRDDDIGFEGLEGSASPRSRAGGSPPSPAGAEPDGFSPAGGAGTIAAVEVTSPRVREGDSSKAVRSVPEELRGMSPWNTDGDESAFEDVVAGGGSTTDPIGVVAAAEAPSSSPSGYPPPPRASSSIPHPASSSGRAQERALPAYDSDDDLHSEGNRDEPPPFPDLDLLMSEGGLDAIPKLGPGWEEVGAFDAYGDGEGGDGEDDSEERFQEFLKKREEDLANSGRALSPKNKDEDLDRILSSSGFEDGPARRPGRPRRDNGGVRPPPLRRSSPDSSGDVPMGARRATPSPRSLAASTSSAGTDRSRAAAGTGPSSDSTSEDDGFDALDDLFRDQGKHLDVSAEARGYTGGDEMPRSSSTAAPVMRSRDDVTARMTPKMGASEGDSDALSELFQPEDISVLGAMDSSSSAYDTAERLPDSVTLSEPLTSLTDSAAVMESAIMMESAASAPVAPVAGEKARLRRLTKAVGSDKAPAANAGGDKGGISTSGGEAGAVAAMKVVDLKAKCRAMGLPVSGKKAELQERILRALGSV